jgi:UDP-GlcNAc:undecaprenyl-phosphate GlcNAc-1-phosphate transferase
MVLQPLINLDYLPRAWEQSAAVAAVAAAASCAGGGLLVVTACNATNLLDGLDGLSGGATGILSLGYLALALYLACTGIMSSGGTPADPLRITLAFALLGAICGFIPYNFHPASIFMGDMGSMFLGYVSAALILLFAQFGTSRWFFAALVMYGLPLMDTLLAVIRRTRAGRPVFSADAGHFHHWLLRRGFGMRRAVLVGYAVAAVCVGLGLIVVVLPTKLAFSVYVVAFGWTLVGAAKMGLMGDSAAATDAPADSQEGDLWKKRHRPSRAPRHF